MKIKIKIIRKLDNKWGLVFYVLKMFFLNFTYDLIKNGIRFVIIKIKKKKIARKNQNPTRSAESNPLESKYSFFNRFFSTGWIPSNGLDSEGTPFVCLLMCSTTFSHYFV